MKIKKVIAVIVCLTVVVGAIGGGIHAYTSYQNQSLVAEVQPVANINFGYWGDSETSYGMVTNDSSQQIYLEDSGKVQEVFVTAGDNVSVGDALVRYDTSEIEIEIKRKKLDISTLENSISVANRALEVLKITKPIDKDRPEIDISTFRKKKLKELQEQEEYIETLPEKDAVDSRIYNYVTEDSVPYNVATADGSAENPYIYYCNKDVYAYGSFFNSIRPTKGKDGKHVVFIICKKNSSGKMMFEKSTESTEEPTEEPTETPTEEPTETPTEQPTETPTEQPTEIPTEEPTETPTETPTEMPTETPTEQPTEIPTETPTETPTEQPTETPTEQPTETPTEQSDSTQIAERSTSITVDNRIYLSASKAVTVSVPVADDSISPNTISYDGNTLPTVYDDSRMWYIFSGKEVGQTLQELLDSIEEEQEWEEPEGYSEEELVEAIYDKEQELKKLDIQKRTQELQLQTLEETVSDGIVYAKVDGIVKSVGDPDEASSDSAFMVITGDEGLYVSGSLSELLLDEVKPGTIVTANSWESGMTFDATITEISDYPVSGNSWGDGNPNVSYYQYTAYIQDSSALTNGEYVDLAIQTNQSSAGGLYIDKAYVRQEDGRSYCMIADENNKLKKQYIITGKTVYGSAVEIKSGLSDTDLIAFPYGKTAVEGVTVTEESNMYY